MKRRTRLATAVVLLLLAGWGVVQARVFLRTPGGHGAVSAGQAGWTRAYEAQFQLNGGAGRVEVLGVDLFPREARSALERSYRDAGLQVFMLGTDALAWGMAFSETRVIRLLVLGLSEGRACVVFRLDQSREEFLGSMARPEEHQLHALPWVPGSTPRLFAADESAQLEMEISETVFMPREAMAGLYRALTADGWTLLAPHDSRAALPQALLVARGDRLALVQATAAGTAGRTQVIRLVKRQRSASDIAAAQDLR